MANHSNLRSNLVKPRYNIDELKKAVDTAVDELTPRERRQRLDLVPRERFDNIVADNEDLSEELAAAQNNISELETEINSLETDVQQATNNADEARLAQSVAENRAQSLQDQFQQLNTDFREALQKSIQEGINKVSLQAQNDGLRAEVNALRSDIAVLESQVGRLEDRLEGREAELASGGELLGRVVTITNLQPNDDSRDVRLVAKRGNSWRDATYVAGKTWRVRNTGEERVEIEVIHTNVSRKAIVEPLNPKFALEPGEERTFDLRKSKEQIDEARPRSGLIPGKSRNYDGTLVFRLVSTGESTSFQTRFRKNR